MKNLILTTNGEDGVADIILPDSRVSSGGYWSGTENRHHQGYITVIPESRYIDEPYYGRPKLSAAAERAQYDRVHFAPKSKVEKKPPRPLIQWARGRRPTAADVWSH